MALQKLRTLIVIGGAIITLGPALIAGTVYTSRLQQQVEAMLISSLRDRGELSANMLARRLYRLWLDIAGMAAQADLSDPPQLRHDLSLLRTLDPRYTWIGAADVAGTVVAASDGLLEGESVAEKAWFKQGLQVPTVGDVHPDARLARLLPSVIQQQFVEISAPVAGKRRPAEGVIGASVDWNWIKNVLEGFDRPDLDVLLISRSRHVIFGPDDYMGQQLSVGSAIAAGQATSVARSETWPDGRTYMTVVVPTLQYEDLPSFGWSFIVRQDLEAAIAPVRQLVRSFWISFLSASVAVMILLYFVAGWIAVPLTRLAVFAEELAGGKVERPAPEAYRYTEARRLSNSLARVQSQLESVLSNKERWQKIRASLEASENRSPPKQASG